MEIIFKHCWILFIVVTTINGFIFRKQVQDNIASNPELKPGYDKLIRGWFIFANIPWVVMGLGIVLGYTNSAWDYFRPALMNPMVLAFHGSVIIIWLLGTYWIFFNNGAEFLVSHPGFVRYRYFGRTGDVSSTMSIKLLWLVGIAGGIMGMVMMWSGWPVPH